MGGRKEKLKLFRETLQHAHTMYVHLRTYTQIKVLLLNTVWVKKKCPKKGTKSVQKVW